MFFVGAVLVVIGAAVAAIGDTQSLPALLVLGLLGCLFGAYLVLRWILQPLRDE